MRGADGGGGWRTEVWLARNISMTRSDDSSTLMVPSELLRVSSGS